MNRTEKQEYADKHLTNLTPAQYQDVTNYIIWGPDEGFQNWILDAKTRFENQASAEEIGLAMSFMSGEGNNARKQLDMQLAHKKAKEDQLLTDAMSHLKV